MDNNGTPGVPRVILTFGYTGQFRTSRTDNLNPAVTTNYVFDAAGRMTGVNLGQFAATVTLGYDNDSRLTSIQRKDSSNGFQRLDSANTYDNAGRLTRIVHSHEFFALPTVMVRSVPGFEPLVTTFRSSPTPVPRGP